MKNLNPFIKIQETKRYPYARLQRTSIKTKFLDTFNVLVGEHDHVGVFDYPTLFMGQAFTTLTQWAEANKGANKLASLIYYPSVAAEITFAVIIAALAVVTLFFIIPVICTVHVIANYSGIEAYDKALSLEGNSSHGYQTINNLLLEKSIDIEDLRTQIRSEKNNGEMQHHITFSYEKKTYNNNSMNIEYIKIEDFDIVYNEKDKKRWSAFFKYNIGRIATSIEEQCDDATAEKAFALFTSAHIPGL